LRRAVRRDLDRIRFPPECPVGGLGGKRNEGGDLDLVDINLLDGDLDFVDLDRLDGDLDLVDLDSDERNGVGGGRLGIRGSGNLW
jgi:hypothetical protein